MLEYEEHSTELQKQIEDMTLQHNGATYQHSDNSLYSELEGLNPSMSMDSLDSELSPHSQVEYSII